MHECMQIEAFFEYYPRRVGQVLLVEAPWVFGPAWEVIRPLMRKYAALVRGWGGRPPWVANVDYLSALLTGPSERGLLSVSEFLHLTA